MDTTSIISIIILVFLVAAMTGFKAVPEHYCFVVERGGAFHRILNPGVSFTLPLIDRVAFKIGTDEHTLNLTHHDKEMTIRLQVKDVKTFAYAKKAPFKALEEEAIRIADSSNTDYKEQLNDVVIAWGIKIISFDIQ